VIGFKYWALRRSIRMTPPMSVFTLLWRDSDMGLLAVLFLVAMVAAGVFVVC
jgi:hypothetical protein